jgi:uncharacterized protein YjbJ (UPF0337 family)
MNTQTMEKNWSEIKGKIKAKWSKFNDDEVESFKKDFNQLSGKVQKTYGIAKDIADREFDEFKKSVQSLMGPESLTEVRKVSPIDAPTNVGKAAEAIEPKVAKIH